MQSFEFCNVDDVKSLMLTEAAFFFLNKSTVKQ